MFFLSGTDISIMNLDDGLGVELGVTPPPTPLTWDQTDITWDQTDITWDQVTI